MSSILYIHHHYQLEKYRCRNSIHQYLSVCGTLPNFSVQELLCYNISLQHIYKSFCPEVIQTQKRLFVML